MKCFLCITTLQNNLTRICLLFPDSYFTVMKFHYRMLKSKFLSLSLPKICKGWEHCSYVRLKKPPEKLHLRFPLVCRCKHCKFTEIYQIFRQASSLVTRSHSSISCIAWSTSLSKQYIFVPLAVLKRQKLISQILCT